MSSEDLKGVGFAFYTKMQEHANKISQIDALTGESDTYTELLRRSVRTAIKLQEKGLTTEDVVMTCALNYRNTFVLVIAAQLLGAITSALDPTLSHKDIVHLLKQVPPKIIFVMPDVSERIEKVLEEIGLAIEIVVFGETTKHTPFSDFLEPSKLEETFRPIEVDGRSKTAMVIFSSGSTGLSKGICINHSRFLKYIKLAAATGHEFSINLSTNSLYWIGSNIQLAVCLLYGFTRILLPFFNAKDVWKAIDTYKITIMGTTPLQYVDLINKKTEVNGDGSSLRQLVIGGVVVYKTHVDIINAAFPKCPLFINYGLTETGVICLFRGNDPDDLKLLKKNPTSCGRMFPEYPYKIVDVKTREVLGPNQEGELLVQGDILFNGYYNMDSSDLWEDGWFKTGDIAYEDEDGCMFIVDRIKELLKFRLWHVAPGLLEKILFTHPAVAKCIVIGIPHEMDGDHPMALVVLKESFKETKAEEIKEFVENQVDDRKKLRGGVKIVDSIPVLLSGKTRRKTIKDMVLSGEL